MIKLKFFLWSVIACSVFAIACENRQTENAAAIQNQTANNQSPQNKNAQTSASGSAQTEPARTNENTNAQATDETGGETEKAEFDGTAGITDRKKAVKGVAVLKAVRAAAHPGFDRIVFEFEGAEMPSYHIEYIDKPVRACGSGDTVPLKGDGWLEIRFTPAAAHTEEGKPTVENREQAPNFKIIKEIKSTCDFEAQVEWVLGVASPNKYRVLELKNPTRLAVDIKH